MYTENSSAETSGSLRHPIAPHDASPDNESGVSDAECALVLRMDNDTLAESPSTNKRKRDGLSC